MGYKTILVCLNEVRRLDETIEAAVKLARAFEAHVSGLFVVPAIPFYVSLGVDAITKAFEGQHRYFGAHAEQAKAAFASAMQKAGVGHDFEIINSKNTLVWDELVEYGLSADLILMSATRRDVEKSVEDYLTEEAVMRSGRPVIILPYEGEFRLSFDTIVVAWNGKREAARAVFDALPIVKLARKVRIVAMSKGQGEEDRLTRTGDRLVKTLSRHGIEATVHNIEEGGDGAGRTLMKYAADCGAGLIIMGAYGHARNREYVFGGATFEMLLNLNRPVLMSN